MMPQENNPMGMDSRLKIDRQTFAILAAWRYCPIIFADPEVDLTASSGLRDEAV